MMVAAFGLPMPKLIMVIPSEEALDMALSSPLISAPVISANRFT